MELIWRFTDESIKTAAQCYENAADILSEAGLDRLAAKVIDEEQGLCSRLAETAARRDFDGMERIDFSRAEAEGSDYIKTAAEGFVDDGIFLREEIDAVDFDRVTGFFRTDLGKRCAEAYRKGLLERERPFDLMTDYAGERVIVQGIMNKNRTQFNTSVAKQCAIGV